MAKFPRFIGKRKTTYWSLTRTPFYSFVFTLPLFGVYEVLTLFISREKFFTLRNGADALFRQFLTVFGIYGVYVLSIMFIIGFVISFLWQKVQRQPLSVHGDYLIKMFGEGIGWGIVLYFIMRNAPNLLMSPIELDVTQLIILAVGAGIYEELVFRVCIVNLSSFLLQQIFLWSKEWRLFVSVLVSAVLFSLFHFFGPYGESYQIYLFLIRSFAGILLGALYVFRGFGITAYAHMVYDFIVVLVSTTAAS